MPAHESSFRPSRRVTRVARIVPPANERCQQWDEWMMSGDERVTGMG
jgi:hypothetical protein